MEELERGPVRHLIDPMDLSVEEVEGLLNVAQDIINNRDKYR